MSREDNLDGSARRVQTFKLVGPNIKWNDVHFFPNETSLVFVTVCTIEGKKLSRHNEYWVGDKVTVDTIRLSATEPVVDFPAKFVADNRHVFFPPLPPAARAPSPARALTRAPAAAQAAAAASTPAPAATSSGAGEVKKHAGHSPKTYLPVLFGGDGNTELCTRVLSAANVHHYELQTSYSLRSVGKISGVILFFRCGADRGTPIKSIMKDVQKIIAVTGPLPVIVILMHCTSLEQKKLPALIDGDVHEIGAAAILGLQMQVGVPIPTPLSDGTLFQLTADLYTITH